MTAAITQASHSAWLKLQQESVIDPEMPIIDAHHHLFHGYGKPVPWQPDYWQAEQAEDLSSGHRVIATVYVECGYGYRKSGPLALAPVGETETIHRYGTEFAERHGIRATAGIVGFADLRLGAAVDEVLQAHLEASPRFRGIRQILNWDPSEQVRYPGYDIQPGLALDSRFQEGFSRLAQHGLSFDVWLFHPQLPDIMSLAKRFPETTLILDHVGGPVGVGPYQGRRDEIYQSWSRDLSNLARFPNVMVKLGGLGMEHAGFGWHERPTPPSSDELAAAMRPYVRHAIDAFGTSRCMFEANFPVDKISYSYRTLWNAYKKLVSDFSTDERRAMLCDNAARIYRLEDLPQ